MPPTSSNETGRAGALYGLGAYTAWGLVPIFWKGLTHVPALELLAHRMVWSLGFVLLLLLFKGRRRERISLTLKTLASTATPALLVGVNWGIYIWAVTHGFIVEASLGYFINPLLNVLLGSVLHGEKLRRGQVAAVSIAAVGVAYLTLSYGRVPWVALSLASTFSIYGVLKKRSPIGAIDGIGMETALLFLPAVGYLIVLDTAGIGALGGGGGAIDALLVASGIVTALPLVLFAAAAKRLPLSVLGLLQYLAPTLQFLLGVFLYREPFSLSQLVGFIFIWSALAIYSGEGLHAHISRQRAAATG